MAAEASLPYKSTERLVFEDISGIAKRIGVVMQYNDFIHVPDNIGGHVSVFLWYPAYVTDKDGNHRREIIFRLGVTNHTYLSNFGGGFKANTGGIVAGLQKELDEEIPLWSEYVMKEIHKSEKGGGQCLFLGIRQQLADHVKPIYKYGKKQTPTPLKVIIFVPVSSEHLNRIGFQPTPEIRGIVDKTLPEFHNIVDHRPNIGSDSINIYHTFRKKTLERPVLRNILNRYFDNDLPASAELLESNLDDNRVAVTLMNGKTQLRFSNIRYNNKNASKNAEEGWEIRKEYGKKVMQWQPGMPRIYPPIKFRPRSVPPSAARPSAVKMKEIDDDEKKESPRRPSSADPKNKTASRSTSRSPSTSKPPNNNNLFIEVTTRAQRKIKKNITRRNNHKNKNKK